MKREIFLTTAGDLADFLEKEIAAGRNPATPEEWADCLKRMAEEKQVQSLGTTDMTPGYIAGSLRDEGMNCRVWKPDDKIVP